MRSIKVKIVIMFLALVFIVMVISGTYSLMRIKNSEISKTSQSLADYSQLVDDTVVQKYEMNDFQKGLNNLPPSNYECSILTTGGTTLSSTEIEPNQGYLTYVNQAVISAENGVSKVDVSDGMDADGVHRHYINYATPVTKDGSNYIIFIRTDAQPLYDTLTGISTTMLMTLILALFITTFIGSLFANTITGPITALTKNAKAMAAGNLNQKIHVQSNDEIGQLTESFNNMALELNNSMGILSAEKNKLEVVLHNMSDGILAYDKFGNPIHVNTVCRELLEVDGLEELTLDETKDLLDVGFDSKEIDNRNILKEYTLEHNDKFINVTVTTYLDILGNLDGTVLVLRDITKSRKLENMRKIFVANVSHEIRTPLTTIKSYTETLLDGALDDSETTLNFLNTINSETDRMTALTSDLLELSQLESGQLTINFEDMNLIESIDECIFNSKVPALKSNISIKFIRTDEKLIISGDRRRVNQVINNIIGNAIKYSGEGSTIEIGTNVSDFYFEIYIKDQGIGIPKESLEHIYERFYRVDKARSRNMGGTGLGLAICKEIMELHGGKILANSRVGEGTTMFLRFLR